MDLQKYKNAGERLLIIRREFRGFDDANERLPEV